MTTPTTNQQLAEIEARIGIVLSNQSDQAKQLAAILRDLAAVGRLTSKSLSGRHFQLSNSWTTMPIDRWGVENRQHIASSL
jgi:hypothetical protein